MITVLLTASMASTLIGYVDAKVREGGVDTAVELNPLASALLDGDLTVSLSPVEADKIVVYIDGKVREGGVDSAVELAPLAKVISEELAEFRAESDEADPMADEPISAFARDEDLSTIAQDAAENGVIDATEDDVPGLA